jgi:acetate kinase
MRDYVLVLNAGSSSLKFGVYVRPEDKGWQLESRGQIEGIGTSPRIRASKADGEVLIDQRPATDVRDGRAALDALAVWLRSMYGGGHVIGVGHRVVHGGTRYTRPVIVTPEVLADLYRLTALAPLHQPYNLEAIKAVSRHLGDVPQVACFDTSFHRTMPLVAELVPLPPEICSAGVRRYGFHGLSYEYIASALSRAAPEIAKARVIVAHLGNGASLCALKAGRSMENTFGFTVLDGLCMGTRPGALDPGVVLYLFQQLGLSAREVETMLYQKSGLLAISEDSSDMRTLLASTQAQARLAIDYFVYQATKEIGALAAVLGGIDGLVFTAGIGENSGEIRRRICAASAWLGIELDEQANTCNGPRISAAESRVSVWVIPTNEELIIASHTGMLLGLISKAAPVEQLNRTQGDSHESDTITS